MSAFIDVSCPECNRKYGFCGKLRDRPACPRCGYAVPQAELDEAQAKMDRAQELIFSSPTQAICGEQRVMAGLSLRQAAKMLGVEPRELSDMEHGRAPLNEVLAAKMAEVYGVGD